MLRSAGSKLLWLAKGAAFFGGAVVTLALVLGVTSMAFGANGQNFILGQLNRATAKTQLNGNVSGGPALHVGNPNTAAGSKALQLTVADKRSPLTVNATGGGTPGKALNLNADKLDGVNSTEIGVNGLQRIEASSAEDSASPKQVTASCPSGKILVGTGFDIFGAKSGVDPNIRTDVVMDFVIPGSASVTVAAYEVNGTTANWYVRAFAICATAP